MEKQILINIANNLTSISDAVKSLADFYPERGVKPDFPEKVSQIVLKLGPKKAAQRLDVDTGAFLVHEWR